ncbi:hypothetical protein [Haloimpatiens massiliensis]|nr:hypothetical protein [Haloimpatiens massiliensis]
MTIKELVERQNELIKAIDKLASKIGVHLNDKDKSYVFNGRR